MIIRSITLGALLILLATGWGIADTQQEDPKSVFLSYIESLKNSDFQRAQKFWVPSDVELSHRLGIAYINTPVKVDCASPIIKNLDGVRSGLVRVAVNNVIEHDDKVELLVKVSTGTSNIIFPYYVVSTESGLRLASASRILTRDWNIHKTKYADIYFTDSSRINSFAFEAVDRFVESTAEKLGISADALENLADKRIIYYLCDSTQIKTLTGYDAQGMTDFPSDAIITRHLPHKHELAHLLMNYSLKRLPLYTSPFMQEGIATCLGGRWGRSPEILDYTGYAVLKFELANPDDILTYDGFHRTIASPDISYPISSLFAKFLIDNYGIEKFKYLYLAFSGSDLMVQSWSSDHAKVTIESALGVQWEQIAGDFEAFQKEFSLCGVEPSENPGNDKTPFYSLHEKVDVSIRDMGESYLFSLRIPEGMSGGILMFTVPDSDPERSYLSSQFEKQLPDDEYSGENYCVRFTSAEVGCYNYFTDELTASYVLSFALDFESLTEIPDYTGNKPMIYSISKEAFGSEDLSTFDVRFVLF